MRTLILVLTVLLAACNMQSMADRMIPDDVMADAEMVVDEVMAGDLSSVRAAFPEASGAEFEGALESMAAEVRAGSETAREIVGVQTNRSVSTSDGSSSTYAIGHEVQTENGFTVISQTWVDIGDGPALTQINIEGSDSSMAARIRRIGMAARIIGFAFLLGLIAIGIIFLRRRRLDADV